MDFTFRSMPLLQALAAMTELFVGLTVAGTAAGFALERVLAARPVFAVPLDPGQYRHELIGNAKFLVVASVSFAVALSVDVVRMEDTGSGGAVVTFLALALAFQAYYYVLHRLLHERSLVRFHRWHHVSRVTTPLSGQSMSVVEALGWMVGYIGVPAAMSLVTPISSTGWLAYIVYNVLGNIVGHANVEVVPRLPFKRYTSLLSNTFVFHALHHARWTGHYGFGTCMMDRLCHTEWADWPELHDRTATGKPLTDLRERGVAHTR